jgi:hypothetical protein
MRLLKAVKPDLDPGDEVTARRYSGELTEALRQDVRKVVLEASAQSPPERGWQGVAVGGLVISLATWGAWAMNGRQDLRVARASVAFSSANGVRGVRVGAEDLVPTRERAARPTGGTDVGRQMLHEESGKKADLRRPVLVSTPKGAATERRGPAAPSPNCTNCGAKGEWETVFDAARDEPLVVRAAEPAPKAVVNVGARIAVTLLEPVMTGGAGAPVRGRVDEDVLAGSRVAIPKGAVFVGRAFATETDDRVQVLFAWLVMAGTSHPVRAVVLGGDSGLGLKGRRLQRASRGRNAGGKVLGTVGRVLSFGLLSAGGADLAGLAARDAVETVGDSLRSTAQRWVVSDKVVHLAAGTGAVAYLEADLDVE